MTRNFKDKKCRELVPRMSKSEKFRIVVFIVGVILILIYSTAFGANEKMKSENYQLETLNIEFI